MSVFWIPVLAIVGGITLAICGAYWSMRTGQRKMELRAEVQTKLIERFGSTTEMIEFMKSPVGREFVSGVQQGSTRYTRERIISGYRRSIILSMLGAALTLLTLYDHDFLPFGIIVLCLGLGYLGATIVAMRLSEDSAQPSSHPAPSDEMTSVQS